MTDVVGLWVGGRLKVVELDGYEPKWALQVEERLKGKPKISKILEACGVGNCY